MMLMNDVTWKSGLGHWDDSKFFTCPSCTGISVRVLEMCMCACENGPVVYCEQRT